MIKKTCFYYWLIEPLRPELIDPQESVPAFDVPITFRGQSFKLALFTDGDGIPQFARLEISCLEKEEIPETLLPMIQGVREHLLSVLRVTYDQELQFFRRPMWTFVDEGNPRYVHLKMEWRSVKTPLNAETTKNFLLATSPFSEELRLFVDGVDQYIPLQYRYLSLYKLLELHFKKSDGWRAKELANCFQPFADDFRELGVTGKPLKHIHQLRDKCAHIKVGKKNERFGVTHLRRDEAAQVEKILPILANICSQIIQERSGGSFAIGIGKPPANELRMFRPEDAS